MIQKWWDWIYSHPTIVWISVALVISGVTRIRRGKTFGESEIVEVCALTFAGWEALVILGHAMSAPENNETIASFVGAALLLYISGKGFKGLLSPGPKATTTAQYDPARQPAAPPAPAGAAPPPQP